MIEVNYGVAVQRALWQQGLVFEHYFLNAAPACDWSPGTRRCVVCMWHALDRVAPL